MNIPRYRKLYLLLRDKIKEGVYKEGDLLPSENELSLLHKLTRPTIRLALDLLVKDGYINKQQGKGSIVTIPAKEIGILSIQGTTTAIGKNNLITKIIGVPKKVQWELPFFFDLSQKEIKAGCIVLERIRYVKNKPVFYDITYMPNIDLKGFISLTFENKSLFEILNNKYRIEVTGGAQKIRAVLSDNKISKYLKIKKDKPVLHLQRKLYTTKKDYVFYSCLYCNTEFYSLYGTF